MDECLPIHPQPREGESLTSWVRRLADSNVYTIRHMLAYYLGEADWRHRDLEFLNKTELAVLANLGFVQGGTDKLWSMVLTPWKESITQPNNIMDQKGWVCSRSTTRYCPSCLSRDQVPYLRLLWRLHFLPICSDHHVVLHRQYARNAYSDLALLKQGVSAQLPLIKPVDCDSLFRFGSSINEILENKKLPERMKWPYGAQEFFLVLLTLVRYFNLYMQRDPSWSELLHEHGLPCEPRFDWRENDASASLLINRALGLIEDWPTNILGFVRKNRTRFKRLRTEYVETCPKVLSDLIAGNDTVDSASNAKRMPDLWRIHGGLNPLTHSREDRVREAVQYLLNSHMPVSGRAISKVAGVSFASLKNSAILEIVEEGRARFKLQQEMEVQNAVQSLRTRALEVTIAGVAAYLGRSHRYLQKSPNLLAIVFGRTASPI